MKNAQRRRGSVIIFGVFSAQGTTPVVCLNSRVNATVYRNLLEENVLPILDQSRPDDDPKSVIQRALSQGQICVKLPSGTKRGAFGLATSKSRPKPNRELMKDSWGKSHWRKLQKNWANVDTDTCVKLIESYSLDVLRLLKAKDHSQNIDCTC